MVAKNDKELQDNNFDYTAVIESLTDHELFVATMMVIRKINNEAIAARLNLNARTIDFFRKQLFIKLKVADKFELALLLNKHMLS